MITSAAETPSDLMDVDGNAAAIVGDGAGAIGVERDGDAVGMAGERFVDGVVDDFIDHVMQARTIVGVADIHAGALAHRIEAFEHLDGIGVVGRQFCFVTLWHSVSLHLRQGSRFHMEALGTAP